jgi:hypothetical protein
MVKGDHKAPGVVVVGFPYFVPSFCDGCGRPYPWTEAKLQTARDLADELDELSPEDRERLKGSLEDLICNTSRTTVAATIFKKATAKVGAEGGAALKKIVTDIACEVAKRLLFPTPSVMLPTNETGSLTMTVTVAEAVNCATEGLV